MARKGLAGQLNMFDFFKSMEDIPMGEVQMVSLMPEDELEVAAEPEKADSDEESSRPTVKVQRITSSGNDKPAMCRQYVIDGRQLEIAYINYNKVRITREGQEPEVHIFESSKEAVDYYVQKMQELEPEEE